jgi:hypothetical protein
MDTPIFSFLDKDLDAARAQESELFAVLGGEGLSTLATGAGGMLLALQGWDFASAPSDPRAQAQAMRIALGSADLLALSFGRRALAWASPFVTFVPKRLFHADHLADYFKILLPPGGAWHYGHEALPQFDCFLIYAVPQPWVDAAAPYFHAGQRTHVAAPLLSAWQQHGGRAEYEIFANLRGSQLQIAVLERRNLLFFNTFQFQKSSDALYSTLLVYDQFRLSPLEVPLRVSGSLVEDSELYRLLYRYIRTIEFLAPEHGAAQHPNAPQGAARYFWFDIVSLSNGTTT